MRPAGLFLNPWPCPVSAAPTISANMQEAPHGGVSIAMFWNVPLDQVTAVCHGSGACQDAKSLLVLSQLVFPGPREVLNPVPGA